MNKVNLLLIIIACLLTTGRLTAAEINFTDVEKKFIAEHSIIKAQNNIEFMPFNFYKNGNPQGYTVDYLKILARKIGIHIEFIPVTSCHDSLAMLKSRRIDIIGNVVELQQRKNYALFTKPIFKYSPAIITRNDSHISSITDLRGKKIAVVAGYWGDDVLREYFPDITIVKVLKPLDALKKVAYGEIEAVIGNATVFLAVALEHNIGNLVVSGDLTLPDMDKYYDRIAVRRDWPVLLSILNKAIAAVTYREELELKKKWIDQQSTANSLDFTDEEFEYLINKGSIRMSVDPDFLPYEGVDSHGQYQGIGAEFVQEFQKFLPVPIELIPTKNWRETIDNAKNGRCDILPLLNKTPQREAFLNFTEPYLTDAIVIIARKSEFYLDGISALNNKKVSIASGYYISEVIEKDYPEIELVNTMHESEAFNLVSEEKAFATVTSVLTASRIIRYYGISNLKIAGQTQLRDNFRVGVVKNEPVLFSIMQKVVNHIDQKQRNEILSHWYTVGFEHKTDYRIVWQVAGIGVVLVILLVLNIVSSHRYNKKITESNEKLQAKNTELNHLRVQLEYNILELNKLAITDKLTGLYNRVKIDATLHQQMKFLNHKGYFFGVILLDIDHFKDVNDNYGHQVGDYVLKTIATLIRENTRFTDIVGRWGGEEFIIICPETGARRLGVLTENLRTLIEKVKFNDAGQLTASFGYTVSRNEADSIVKIVSRADKALYDAKQSGRNTVRFR